MYKYLILLHHRWIWWERQIDKQCMLLEPTIERCTNTLFKQSHEVLKSIIFTSSGANSIYSHTDLKICPTQETMEHRILRSRNALKLTNVKPLTALSDASGIKLEGLGELTGASSTNMTLLPEFPHRFHPAMTHRCWPTEMPQFLYGLIPRVVSSEKKF